MWKQLNLKTFFKTCHVLTNKSIKNLSTTSKQLKVPLHQGGSDMAPLVITKSWNISWLLRGDQTHHFWATMQFYQQVIPQHFLLSLFLANHQFLGKCFEPIHSDHFWLQSRWPLAIYFLKRPWFSIAQYQQSQNFFFGYSISDALAMIADIPSSSKTRTHWLCVVLTSIIFYNKN